jgi:hypothetical protein
MKPLFLGLMSKIKLDILAIGAHPDDVELRNFIKGDKFR